MIQLIWTARAKHCRGKTGNQSIEPSHRERIESNGKPAFSFVYATRIEFLRTTTMTSLKIAHTLLDLTRSLRSILFVHA